MNSYTKAFTYDTAGNITKESTYAYTTGPVGNPFPAPPSGSPAWCYLTPTLLGDANCDGVVNMADVTAINNYLVGLGTLTNQGMKNADVNYSHTVNSADAGAIQNYLVQTGTLPPTASPNKVVEYTYSSGQWKDQLTGTVTKTYNNSGTLTSTVTSPTVTYNADGNMTKHPVLGTNSVLYWNGNQLSEVGASGICQMYAYDKNGLRFRKTDDELTGWQYYYNGGQLERMEQLECGYLTGITMTFLYDAAGKPWTVHYNGTRYTYEYNAQGDVIGLLNTSNQRVVEYRYDAWGKPILANANAAGSTTLQQATAVMNNQPFRYRGYVWDSETGWYYLKSRYYDPSLKRFISSDALMSTGQGLLGLNMYAYCLNNPVSAEDSDGTMSEATKAQLALRDAAYSVLAQIENLEKRIRSIDSQIKRLQNSGNGSSMIGQGIVKLNGDKEQLRATIEQLKNTLILIQAASQITHENAGRRYKGGWEWDCSRFVDTVLKRANHLAGRIIFARPYEKGTTYQMNLGFGKSPDWFVGNTPKDDYSGIPIGAIVYKSSGRAHVGIYLGNGLILDNSTPDGRFNESFSGVGIATWHNGYGYHTYWIPQ